MRRNWFGNPAHAELLDSPGWADCEERIEAFELAWRQGHAPDIAGHLCATGPIRQALLAELIHVDLEFRLKAGETARIQTYLNAFPDLAGDRHLTLDLIVAEFELRRRRQEDVSLDEYAARFPEHRDELLQRLRLDDVETKLPTGKAQPTRVLAWPCVPGYEIIGEIGRGGMGVVYKALEPSLRRHVALKFLPAEFVADPDRLQRFLREARTASALNHPHICVVHALGECDHRPFIVMEFIEGQTLHAQIGRRPAVEKVAQWIGQAARALAAAHAAGVVHRDIKPENIMIRHDGYVKVLDFGLARRLPTLAQPDAGGSHDTDPGGVFGTVAYMSPEQTRGDTVDTPSDVFSLGIVLYQLATGRHPFEAESALGMLHAIAARQPAAPARLNPEIPAGLERLIEAMLNKHPPLRPTATEVETALGALASAPVRAAAPAAALRPIVHREPELAALRSALERADAGRGALVCVAGEPGIGKTTLVEDFLQSPALAGRSLLMARGHCSERLGGAEAFMPVVDALQDLMRGDSSGAVGRLMKLVAPTWYVQVAPAAQEPNLPEPAERGESSRALSQQALLREVRNILDEASRLGPVVLFFDDVHWADVSTVDLLAHLGRHCQGMRLLVIVTYRPTELLLGPHPFHGVKLELETRGACQELLLGFLSRDDVERYMALAFPGHAFPADLGALIHARTEGSPLFVADLLRYLRESGVIAELDGRWSLARELPDLLQDCPGSVRSMIQRKLERLDGAERRLLAAASVQGAEFDSAVVAGALDLDAGEVDERLQHLERVHGLVRAVREHEFPDRTLTLRYAFVHILYQQALYAALPPSRRASLAGALARRLEVHQGEGGLDAAALACLYEVGRDFFRAARHFWLAAQNAARVFAHREAVELARRGLRLLDGLPETRERAGLELPLQTTLALQLQMTEGFAAPDARAAYMRAHALCDRIADPPRFPVLWGLWLIAKVRSELPRAQAMADELLALSLQLQEPALALQAHQAMGMTAFCRGEPATAVRHVEQAAAIYDPGRHRMHSFSFGQDPSVICKAVGGVALWLLGYPEQAQRQCDVNVRSSRELSPSSQAVALHFAAMLHQLRRDGRRAREFAQASAAVAGEHGFSFWSAGANVLGGWALAADGHTDEGTEQLRRGLAEWQATDSVTYMTYYMGLLAEVLGGQGQTRHALRLLEEALALARQTGEGLYEAELHRLRGEALLRDAQAPAAAHALAADAFRQALELARRQDAKSLELRAALSLARLAPVHDQPAAVRQPLAEVFARFSEGWDTPDLREAKNMLAALA